MAFQTIKKLVIASANPDKVEELRHLVGSRFEVMARPQDLAETVEDLPTLEGNAIKKATEVAQAAQLPALADDTGLFVDALDGAPGVLSARYAGPKAKYSDNVEKLLNVLGSTRQREASFVTVVAVAWPSGEQLVAEGKVEGTIGLDPVGQNGFGYDPIFVPNGGDGSTFAQINSATKSDFSHRSRALSALIEKLT